jgi:hypothetical protein
VIEEAATTDRYQVLRRIGAGGMGVVYEAEDKERNQKVALKTINDPNVEQVYQLKREFRALADLSHPNLVALCSAVLAGRPRAVSRRPGSGDAAHRRGVEADAALADRSAAAASAAALHDVRSPRARVCRGGARGVEPAQASTRDRAPLREQGA